MTEADDAERVASHRLRRSFPLHTVIYVAIDNVPPGDRVKEAEEADTTGPPGA